MLLWEIKKRLDTRLEIMGSGERPGAVKSVVCGMDEGTKSGMNGNTS